MRSQPAGSLQLLLGCLEFALEGGVLMRPKELSFEVTNGGRAATVAVCAKSNQFESSRAKAVIGHDDGGDSRLDEKSNLREMLLEPLLAGVEIKEDYVTRRLS